MAEPCETIFPRHRKPRLPISLRLEWRPNDLWVGIFWRHQPVWLRDGTHARLWEVWVALLPMLPLRISWRRKRRF